LARKPLRTLAQLARQLADGRTTGRALVEECLSRIAEPQGEGQRTFLKVHETPARAAADYHDRMRQAGAAVSPFAGIPISVKDLFDVAGDTTAAGSAVLRNAPHAQADCPAVARLRAAGFIVLGRTNMTEFAFSGLGVNPHYGTPLSPWDRTRRRIPGGSSSGAGVSISDGMAFAAMGTDTGGSCRIPAAFCGVVGFKPTAERVPKYGVYPLSETLDSVGPLANTVNCCATLDAILAGGPSAWLGREFDSGQPAAPPGSGSNGANSDFLSSLRLGVLTSYVVDAMDKEVARAYQRALSAVGAAGTMLTEIAVSELDELREINKKGGLVTAEAYSVHRARLTTDASSYDPRVAQRILRAREQDAADYIELLRARASFIERVSRRIARFDAILMPTVPIVPPAFDEVAADEAYLRTNALVLRNSSLVNFLDGCGISIPCHEPGSAPVGLTLFGLRNSDRHLLRVAGAVEHCLD
jgi:aspartyl-tRNA(Asn)/glutamyl-tRNA(Gln) amidotransferase subunit A